MTNKNNLKKEIESRNAHLNTLKKIKIKKEIKINKKFLQSLLNIKIIETRYFNKRLNTLKLKCSKVIAKEAEKINLNLLERIISNKFSKSGKKKIQIWEKGWQENLKEINKGSTNSILPKYYRKNNRIFRIKGFLVYSKNFKFDAELQELVHLSILNTFARKIENIYEFGAGSGNVITRLMQAYGSKYKYYASDWAYNSIKILKKIIVNNIRIKTFKFDFFKPNNSIVIENNSLVITNGALEQTGINFKKFILYLLKQKPELVVNFEPISEFYTNDNLNDYILNLYSKKRNYLEGYFSYLKYLEKKKKIKIIKYRRVAGGLGAETFSYIVWKCI